MNRSIWYYQRLIIILFGDPCLFTPTNGMSFYGIYFLFDMNSFNFKLDSNVDNNNNKTIQRGSNTTSIDKHERFNLMLSTTHNCLFDNSCLSESANEMSLYGIQFLFNMYFFNFKLNWDVDNNKTNPTRIQWDQHQETWIVWFDVINDSSYLFDNLCLLEPANGMSLRGIQFLLCVRSFDFKLDWDVNNNKTSPTLLFRVNYIILPWYLFEWHWTPISKLI